MGDDRRDPPGTDPQEKPMAGPTRPDVEPPTGPAPDDLVIEEITVGDGPEAKAGDLVSAHYVGVTHEGGEQFDASWDRGDRKSTRLNSSHANISYAVFCLKKKRN